MKAKDLLRGIVDSARRLVGSPSVASGTKVVHLADGSKVLIGPITWRQYMWFLKSAPELVDALERFRRGGKPAPDRFVVRQEVVAQLEKLRDQVLRAAVVQPQLESDQLAGPARRDFSDADRSLLLREILELTKGVRA